MRVLRWITTLGLALTPLAASAQEAPATPEARIDELEQQVRVLERQAELAAEQAKEAAKTASLVTATREGFSLRSADGAYQLKLRGYVQADARAFLDDRERPGTDSFLLRRVRPIFEGTVFKIFDFRLMPDFGGGTTVLQDAYLEARFKPTFRVRAGKFKTPFGIERLQSGTDLLFVERGLPNNLVPNRDLGVQLSGELAGGVVSWAAGVFNGVADGGSADSDTGDDKDVAARVFLQPFLRREGSPLRGLGFGIAATQGEQEGSPTATGLATYRTNTQQAVFSYRTDGTPAGTTLAAGERQRVSPQLSWYHGPFGLLAEAVTSRQEVRRGTSRVDLEHDAWQVAASWVFGGTASYKGATVRRPFEPAAGGRGALEIAARYNELDLDDDSFPVFANPTSAVTAASSWTLGVNWILNRNVRLVVNYERTRFEGGATTGDRPDDQAIFSRFQISF